MPRKRRFLSALAAPVLAALLVPLLATAPAAAAPTQAPSATAAGAPWLAGQLHDAGDVFGTSYQGTFYPDYGLTADAVLGLAATGEGGDVAAAATAQLQKDADAYVSPGFGIVQSAGATAKLLLVAEAEHLDVHDFGGHDLPGELEALQGANGRFTDRLDGSDGATDYSNSLVQALAVLALHRAGATTSIVDAGAAYLVLQQCPDGGVRVSEADSACTTAGAGDPDITGVALQAFVAAGDSTAADAAAAWLLARQRGDGSFASLSADPTSPTPNANTTALIEGGLLAHGDDAAAAKARSYLASLQLGCAAPPEDRGAVAYDTASRNAAITDGITAQTVGQFRRSTTQALLGLASVSYLTVDAAGSTADAPPAACTAPLVAAAYRGTLDRSPDPGGLAYWSGELRQGRSPLSMIAAFAESSEASRVLVELSYERILHRGADRDGLAYWSGVARRTQRADLIAAQLAASSEQYRADGATNRGWVADTLYEGILGRSADDGGLSYWTRRVDDAGPGGRTAIALAFLSTAEGRRVQLAGLDRQVCGPDTPLGADRSAQLVAGLAASALNPLLTRTAILFGGC